jgi:hypothetical protein
MNQSRITGMWALILLAGLAGGAAEVLWIALYSSATGTSGIAVARQVTASVWPAAAEWAIAPALGVALHMALSLGLAAALVPLLLRWGTPRTGHVAFQTSALAALALALVWVVNFLLVLPVLNPQFVTLMPYGATFLSKLLFAAAMVYAMQQYSAHVARARAIK